MTKPLTHNRVDIKAILADPLLREELIEGATDFICKVEGIRRRKEDLEMTNLSSAAQAVLDAAISICHPETEVVAFQCTRLEVAAALRTAAECSCEEQDTPPETLYEQGYLDALERVFKRMNAIAAELEVLPE
jgi:hypothetical protein